MTSEMPCFGVLHFCGLNAALDNRDLEDPFGGRVLASPLVFFDLGGLCGSKQPGPAMRAGRYSQVRPIRWRQVVEWTASYNTLFFDYDWSSLSHSVTILLPISRASTGRSPFSRHKTIPRRMVSKTVGRLTK